MKTPQEQEGQKEVRLYPLPESWKWVTVAGAGAYQKNAIVDGPFGSNLKVSDYIESGPVPVLTTKNLEGNYGNVRFITHEKFEELKRSAVYPGDILLAKIGSCGKTGIYPHGSPPAMIPANLLKVSLNEAYDLKYVYYYFNSPFFQKALKTIIKATAQPAFGVTNFRKLPLAYAPTSEQKRIVAEIEKQFSRLDEAVASLKRAKANLKRYKATVLKAAVEGKLTEEWRKKNSNVEPAGKLLERILDDHRRKRKYKVIKGPKVETLPFIPKTWEWSNVEQLNPSDRPCTYGVLQPGTDFPSGIRFIRVGDIKDGQVILNELKRIKPEIAARYPRTQLQGGEVLISLVGAIGRTAVVPESLAGANTARAVGVIPLTKHINSRWVELWFRNPKKIKEMTGKAHEVARKTLNLEDVRSAVVAIPPNQEQHQIVAEAGRRLSVVEELEAEVTANLQRAERLRQAILKKAFTGQLTPQVLRFSSKKVGV